MPLPSHHPLTPSPPQAFPTYTLATSAYLTAQSLPLLLTPSLIISLLQIEGDPRRPTDVEKHLCRALGLILLCCAAVILPLTGVLPVGRIQPQNTESDEPRESNPYASPTVLTTLVYHGASAFQLYAHLAGRRTWGFGFTVGLTVSAVMFCFGTWVAVFGGGEGRRSRRTGADKRMGNFPFVNVESAREKKREEKGKRKSVARTKSRE